MVQLVPSGASVADDDLAVRVGQREVVDGALGHGDRDRVEDGHVGGAERRASRDTAATGGRSLVVVVLGELRRARRIRWHGSSGAGVASTVDVTVVSGQRADAAAGQQRPARRAVASDGDTAAPESAPNIIDQPPS